MGERLGEDLHDHKTVPKKTRVESVEGFWKTNITVAFLYPWFN